MQAKRPILLAAAAAYALSLATPVAAQGPDADALFQKGLESMRARQYATACPLLEESYRLDPVPGALFTLAECEAAWGKLEAATRHYQGFLEMLPSLPPPRRDSFEERRKIAIDKMSAVSAMMPEITIDVPAEAREGLVVKRNGAVVAPTSYGVTQKVDPGTYVVTAEAELTGAWERRLALGERDRVRVQVPWPLPAAPSALPSVASPAAAPPAGGDSTSEPSALRPWAYVAGGIGIAGLVTGTVAGIVAVTDKSSIDANCPDRLCNAEGRSAVNAGKSAATISTVALSVGVAAGVLAAVLFAASSKKPVAPGAASFELRPYFAGTPHGATAAVEGTF